VVLVREHIWVILVGALASSCGVLGTDSAPDRGLRWADYNAEFRAEASKLALPVGERWPGHAPAPPSIDGDQVRFERGVGRGDADLYWYCAWGRDALAHLADRKTVEADIKQLAGFVDTPKYLVATLPGDRHYYDDALRAASLGDWSQIRDFVTVNCPPPA
jgi:hypothetical protein